MQKIISLLNIACVDETLERQHSCSNTQYWLHYVQLKKAFPEITSQLHQAERRLAASF